MGTKARTTSTDRELIEFKAVLKALKGILRERKMSYADLAQLLNLSESGIKKIFASKDCSFARLSQISRALGFRIADLLDEVDRAETREIQFSQRQQQYFLKDPRAFRFFVKLAIERQDLSEIQTEFKLSEKETFTLLRKLDALGLIQLHAGNRVKLPPLSLIRNFGDGPLLSKIYQEWGKSIVEEIAAPKFQSSGQFFIRCLRMKEDTYQELLTRLTELEIEFLKRAVREMSVSAGHLKPVRWMWLTDSQSFIKGTL